jgi:long-chain acyl-CoA synthetase
VNENVYTDLLRDSVRRFREKACFHVKRDGAFRTWTYGGFHADLNAAVSALRKNGVVKGDKAIIIGENIPEWVIAYWSTVLAGACSVPVDPHLPRKEIEDILQRTAAKVAFCSPVYEELFDEFRASHSFLEKVVVLGPCEKENGFERFKASGNAAEDAFSERFQPDDPVAVLFTSGTTGTAKGVVLAQRNFISVARHGVPIMKLSSRDTMVAVLPLHHVFGFAACVAAPLAWGLDVVFVPVIKGPLILEALRQKKVSILPAVPQLLEVFCDNIDRSVRAKGPLTRILFAVLKAVSAFAGPVFGMGFRRRLFFSVHHTFGGRLKTVVSGGSSLKKKYFDAFRLMGFKIVEGYGLTETFGPITLSPEPRQGSVGTVLPGNKMKIENPGENGIGEVLFQGNTVFPGYYNDKETTKAVFDAQGWFHTGDLGRVEKNGYLYLTGRIKDVIVLDSGKNVYPDEVEEVYSGCKSIEEIGVIGVKGRGSEIAAAVVVPSKEIRSRYSVEQARHIVGNEISEAGRALPAYKKISGFVLSFNPLPRTTTKKFKKEELKKIYAVLKGPSADAAKLPPAQLSYLEQAAMKSDVYKKVVSCVRQVSPQVESAAITVRSRIELDLMLDSIKRLDLICLLEETFGITVTDEMLEKCRFLGDIVTLVQDAAAGAEGPR